MYALEESTRAASAGRSTPRRSEARPAAPRGGARRLGRAALAVAASAIGLASLAVVVVTPLDLGTQAALAGASFAVALVVGRRRGQLATLALVLISATATA